MSAHTILMIFIVFFLAELGWNTFLTLLNLAYVRRHAAEVPQPFAGVVDPDTLRPVGFLHPYARQIRAAGWRRLFSRAPRHRPHGSAGQHRQPGPPDSDSPVFSRDPFHRSHLPSFLAAGARPFPSIRRSPSKQRFGFNKTTPGLYIVDTLKGFAVSAVIGIPVLLGLFWFMDRTGSLWWIWAFGAMTVVQLVMSVLGPARHRPPLQQVHPASGRPAQGEDPGPCAEAGLPHERDFRRGLQQALPSLQRLLHRPGPRKAHRPLRYPRAVERRRGDRFGARP